MATRERTAFVVLGLAVLVGTSHLIPTALQWSGPSIVAWKGAGVALLAAYAALRARTVDGWLLVVVISWGAAGDVLIDTAGFIPGAAAFAVGHAVAIVLYLRNTRRNGLSSRLVVLVIAAAAAGAIWWLSRSVPIAIYAAMLIGMAATALLSRFPRPLTGLGAVMFVVSDGLIYLRLDVLSTSIAATIGTWALYFVGQLLIVVGVTRTLHRRTRARYARLGP